MRIPQLALALTAAAAFSVLGASPAMADDSRIAEVQSAAAPIALSGLPGLPELPVTDSLGGIVDDVVNGVCDVIDLNPCSRADGDNWKDG